MSRRRCTRFHLHSSSSDLASHQLAGAIFEPFFDLQPKDSWIVQETLVTIYPDFCIRTISTVQFGKGDHTDSLSIYVGILKVN
jgi:hypothetical protein